MSKPRRRRRLLPRWAELPLWFLGAYAVVAGINLASPAETVCVTDSWCIPSREEWWLLSLVQLAGLVAALAAGWLALIWAFRMLASPRRHWWFLLFFATLGLAGLFAWLATVPRADWIDHIHIPIIAGFIMALGVAMYFGFRPRRPTR